MEFIPSNSLTQVYQTFLRCPSPIIFRVRLQNIDYFIIHLLSLTLDDVFCCISYTMHGSDESSVETLYKKDLNTRIDL